MKSIPKILLLFLLFIAAALVASWPAHACGHEGAYVGAAYTQLLQFSKEKQLVSPTVPVGSVSTISWGTRYGGQVKFGYDFCGTRFGVEVPIGVNYQILNKTDRVLVLNMDANAIIHIVETEGGLDFYWMAGFGAAAVTEGTIKDNTRAGGFSVNFGPGLQYFFYQGKQRAAIGVSIPAKYTLYFGDNLSRNHTAVYGIPVHVGLTLGF